ncbi:MAG TPA: C45 family peptidase, partial [Thermoplasmata archaeon]|nr:C45 family peptidase [Thermoplasmata archaeon]
RRIEKNREVYFDRFRREVGVPRKQALEFASAWEVTMEKQCPDFLDGIQGIAEGSGISLAEAVALNVRYEILYFRTMEELAGDGCTAFAAMPSICRSRNVLHGQNWDWIPDVRGAVIRAKEPNGTEYLGFTEAGIFGAKIGLNSHGIGLTVNGMMSTDDDWKRDTVPFHARCREILLSRTLDEAVKRVTSTGPACSANFLVSSATGDAADVELAPEDANLIRPSDGIITHANHFRDPEALGIEEPPSEYHESSVKREVRLRALLLGRQPLTPEKALAALSDHEDRPRSICRHPDPREPEVERTKTKIVAVMDLNRRELRISEGPACRARMARYSLE